MKIASLALAAVGSLAIALPLLATPADAYVVRKTVTSHHGVFGHGCRTVRTVKQGFHGRQVIVRKVCR